MPPPAAAPIEIDVSDLPPETIYLGRLASIDAVKAARGQAIAAEPAKAGWNALAVVGTGVVWLTADGSVSVFDKTGSGPPPPPPSRPPQ